MAQIAFILLCHKDPESIIAKIEQFTSAGNFIAIHFDARSPQKEYEQIAQACASNPNAVMAKKRVKCGWGEWSLIEGTLSALRAALDAFPRASHFYLISGDCMPIKSAAYMRQYLDRNDTDFIESVDFFTEDWIKTGMTKERLIYRHYFNERSQAWLFYRSYELQKLLRLKRPIPQDIDIKIGSQWWCLRRQTIEAIFEFLTNRPDVKRFFSTTWIPDEIFFQTLVRHLVRNVEIRSKTPTFLMFSDYGLPVTFYNDHFDMLLSQDFLFARKISPDAEELTQKLGNVFSHDTAQVAISNEGKKLHKFLTGRGRIGRRFARRIWERENSIGGGRTLNIVVCKKWHVAKRFVDQVTKILEIPGYHYIFHEQSAELPHLGGIEQSLTKRERHRRSLMRMLFELTEAHRLLICADPNDLDLLKDLAGDRADCKILEMECLFDDDYLIGHAKRIGLAGEQTPDDTMKRLLPTVQMDLEYEVDQLRSANFEHYGRIREDRSIDENASLVAEFLGVSYEDAQKVLALEYLFKD